MDYIVTPTAEHLDLDAVRLEVHPQNKNRRFPDGEVYVQLEQLESIDHAVVLHSGQPHPNRGLAFLYGVLDLLAEVDCQITLTFPYVPYSRQDKAFYEGTLNYVRSILRMVTQYYDIDRVYAIDPHFSHRDWVSEYPLEILHAFSLIQEHLDMDDYIVVGPDLGAFERFGVPGFEKARKSAYDVELAGELDVKGKNVLVFDDLISTGGTMVNAYHRLKKQGAATVQAAAVHGVLENGIQRVLRTYDALYLTNTIANGQATVQIESLIENEVR